MRNGRIGKVHTVTVGVPQSDVGCPPQPEMAVPPELDYEKWQGPAPRASYTEKRVTKPKTYERPGWMRHLYYCDGMITNWTTHWNDGAAFATGLERTGPVEIEGTGEYPPADSFWNVLLKFGVKMRFANGVNWTYRTEKPFFRIEGDRRLGPCGVHATASQDRRPRGLSVSQRQEAQGRRGNAACPDHSGRRNPLCREDRQAGLHRPP